MSAACLFWESFSALHGASHIGVCLVPGDVSGPFSSPWEPLFNVSLSAYQNCTKPGWGREKVRKAEQKDPGRGRRNQTMPSPQGPSMMQLTLPFDTLTKEGQTWSPAKLSLFKKKYIYIYYILFCRQEDKMPPPSFLVNFPEPFCDSPIIPIVCACIFAQKQSAIYSIKIRELSSVQLSSNI